VSLERKAPQFLFLTPAQMLVSRRPMIVTTLLGSCVSVTMYCKRLKIGAICHALLPRGEQGEPAGPAGHEAGRYVDGSILFLLERLQSRGVLRGEIEAKLFGGSDMFATSKGVSRSIGQQNIEMALSVLEAEQVRLITQDLGGARGRKIIFHTHSGEVFLKRLRKSEI